LKVGGNVQRAALATIRVSACGPLSGTTLAAIANRATTEAICVMAKNAVSRLLYCALAVALLSGMPAAHAATNDGSAHWVGTWATSPMAAKNESGTLGDATEGATLREIVHVSIGGSSVRVVLSNEFGLEPLNIGAVAIAMPGMNGAANASTPVTFGGHAAVTIPAGALMVSDPVSYRLAPLSDLAVSIYVPAQTITQLSRHGFADQTNYMVTGNAVTATMLDAPKKMYAWDFLKGVDVEAPAKDAAIVTFGDSITDGAHSTRDANHRWPDLLAARLQANKATAGLSVLNEGIGGNRVLLDGTGPSALARLDRDVLSQAGVRYLIVMESINDIGHGAQPPRAPIDAVTADQLITGLEQIITRAHMHGIKVIGATLTPYGGAKYEREDGLKIWAAVNDFIRNGGKFDAVIDFAKVTADPANAQQFLPADDSGDHLHPGDVGYKSMADSIDLKLFSK
jgi:lysophospholipase L1-like esterase